mmetsp:Transcript_17634/g.61689  ORF Transcript_17634/g.61689 Transcript_17634/m.61689 type:complete len:132 (+) Transcript_17634:1257-1652(+)
MEEPESPDIDRFWDLTFGDIGKLESFVENSQEVFSESQAGLFKVSDSEFVSRQLKSEGPLSPLGLLSSSLPSLWKPTTSADGPKFGAWKPATNPEFADDLAGAVAVDSGANAASEVDSKNAERIPSTAHIC